MIKIYKTFGGFTTISKLEKGCWINVVNPVQSEIQQINTDFGLPVDLINDILDLDERSRVEFEDDWTFVILRIPVETSNNGVPFQTIPLGVFMTENYTMNALCGLIC